MKILIIAQHVGKTAPGIVFEKLIRGLSLEHEVFLITSDYFPSVDLSKVKETKLIKKHFLHPRLARFFISTIQIDPLDYLWSLKLKSYANRKKYEKPFIIFSFISSGYYASLIAGKKISTLLGCKFAVYSTDAIPPPVGWIKYDLFYKGLKKMIARYLQFADAFFTTNKQMLKYQLTIFKPKTELLSDIINTPGLEEFKVFPSPDKNINVFLYTGGIYGARKADYLIAGFEKLLSVYPNSKLVFIGRNFDTINLSNFKQNVLQKIEFIPQVQDLDPYYAKALALIDIDADLDNDVFMSSKISNYLMINRIIISETGINSPSRQMFKGINSIIQCDHNAEHIFNAMLRAIELRDTINFEDRNEIIQSFKIENIIKRLSQSLNKLMIK